MVHVEQLYTPCIAHAAYLIVSNGEAAIIDPLRDPKPYLEAAAKKNAKIKYVIETHFHADFVSGHVDLAKAAGNDAKIVFGPTACPGFDALIALDGEELVLGGAKLKTLHTPGHTMESSSFLLINEEGKEECVFTGDALFIGDVGRPDLAQKAANMTSEQLAALLYQSLRTKLMPLADHLIVYPAHGAGSACGKNMSAETSDTLGNQKATNYALRADMTEAEFVKEVLEGQGAAPGYFGTNVGMNKGVNVEFADIIKASEKKISLAEFEKLLADTLVFDSRGSAEFCAGSIPMTQFAGIDGLMAVWTARVFPEITQKYVIVCHDGKLYETVERLARVGFDNCIGHLDGGIKTWIDAGKPLQTVDTITPEAVAALVAGDESTQLVDVRGPGERANDNIPSSIHHPLCVGKSTDIHGIDPKTPGYCFCLGGYRSLVYISNMMRHGYKGKLVSITGGYPEMAKTSLAEKMVKRV